jgi:hypothetical protein
MYQAIQKYLNELKGSYDCGSTSHITLGILHRQYGEARVQGTISRYFEMKGQRDA